MERLEEEWLERAVEIRDRLTAVPRARSRGSLATGRFPARPVESSVRLETSGRSAVPGFYRTDRGRAEREFRAALGPQAGSALEILLAYLVVLLVGLLSAATVPL
jgi:hypothetical protein